MRGTWGGRFPLANWLASNLLQAAVWYRLTTLRLRNGWRSKRRNSHVVFANPPDAQRSLEKFIEDGITKFNIGGGAKQLDGFVNIDFIRYPNVRLAIQANILDLGFMPSGCASHLHSNHVIEHLSESQLELQFREYHRILRPSGKLTVRAPNALGAAFAFWFGPVLEKGGRRFAELGFPRDESFADPADEWIREDLFGLLHWFYGDVGNIANQHLTLITPSGITALVQRAGFRVLEMTEPEALNIVVVAVRE